MRERFCKVCGGWHKLDEWPHNCMPERAGAKSELAGPMIISDTMEPVQSMLDGRHYDSKAALRRTYRDAGVVEVGNDRSVLEPKPRPKPQVDRQQVRNSVDKAFSRAGLGA